MSRHRSGRQWRMMTDEGMALIGLIENRADTDPVRDMLSFAADRIMEFDRQMIDPGDRSSGE